MKTVYIELQKNNQEDIEFLKTLTNQFSVDIATSKRLTGSTELIIVSLQLSSSIIALLASFYALKKKKGKRKIKINHKRIVLENKTESEIETILTVEIDEH